MSTITLSPTPLSKTTPRGPIDRGPISRGPISRGPITVGPTPLAAGAAPSPEARAVVRPAEGEVRLTRRGRLAVFLACVAVVLGVAFFLGASSVATQQPGADAPTEVVTVGTGETLWELAAERTEPGGDVRDMMVRIERLNALESAALDAGQRLRVPAGAPSGE